MSERSPRSAVGVVHRRRGMALLVAVLLGGAAATVAVDVVAVQTAGHALIWPYQRLATDARTTTWADDVPKIVGGAGILVGVLLLLTAAWRPWRSQELRTDAEWLRVVTTPRSLRRSLVRAAMSVDGVGRAGVDLGPRRARIAVVSPLRDPEGLDDQVRAALTRRLEELGLQSTLRVKVCVRGAPAPPVPQPPTTEPTVTQPIATAEPTGGPEPAEAGKSEPAPPAAEPEAPSEPAAQAVDDAAAGNEAADSATADDALVDDQAQADAARPQPEHR